MYTVSVIFFFVSEIFVDGEEEPVGKQQKEE
jgi:hypothetical protein